MRNKGLFKIKCNYCDKTTGINPHEDVDITSEKMRCPKCYSQETTIITYFIEHHGEIDTLINGNPKILILKLPNKQRKGIYRIHCKNCRMYIKNSRTRRINDDRGKCPLCRKDYPSILSEETYNRSHEGN